MQFGIVVMFASFFPLVAVLALLVSRLHPLHSLTRCYISFVSRHSRTQEPKKKVLCFLEVVVPSCQIYVGGVSHRSVVTLQNNLVEIRSDSFKLLKMMKRPVPHVVGSIGAWLHIFQVIFSSLTIVLLPSAMECRNRFVAPFLLISHQIAKWMFWRKFFSLRLGNWTITLWF